MMSQVPHGEAEYALGEQHALSPSLLQEGVVFEEEVSSSLGSFSSFAPGIASTPLPEMVHEIAFAVQVMLTE